MERARHTFDVLDDVTGVGAEGGVLHVACAAVLVASVDLAVVLVLGLHHIGTGRTHELVQVICREFHLLGARNGGGRRGRYTPCPS